MDLFDYVTDSTNSAWTDVLAEVEKVLNGPSAIVTKPTRVGFTHSSMVLAEGKHQNMLLVAPTNKIGEEATKEHAKDSIKIYGHSHCFKIQEELKSDPFMANLPLHLPKDCPCKQYPDCDYRRSWTESTYVRTVTTDKLISMIMSETEESISNKEQLGDLDWIIFDESHLLCMDKIVDVDSGHGHVVIPRFHRRAKATKNTIFWEFKEIGYIYDQYLSLISEMNEATIFEHIRNNVIEVGSDQYHAIEWPNSFVISSESMIAGFGDLKRLAKNRHELGISEEDILHLTGICSLMSNALVCINFLRTSDGDKINISGQKGIFKALLRTFIANVCPKVNVFFVSGTQFNLNNTYEFIANRQLENVIVPDVKNTNSKMTIYPDTWQVGYKNFFKDPKVVRRIVDEIKEFCDDNKGQQVVMFLLNSKFMPNTIRRIKEVCPELLEHEKGKTPILEISYYRSVFSTGVANDSRRCIIVGCAETPSNVNDSKTGNYMDSQALRIHSVDAATWQAISRAKDPEGKIESKVCCIGIKTEKVLRVVTWGTNRQVLYKGPQPAVIVDEMLPGPHVMVPYKKQANARLRKASPYIKTVWNSEEDLTGCPIPVYEISSTKNVKSSYIYIGGFNENRTSNSVRCFGALYMNPQNEDEIRITIETLDRFFRSKRTQHAEQNPNGSTYTRHAERRSNTSHVLCR
jgi:hypothetical protein